MDLAAAVAVGVNTFATVTPTRTVWPRCFFASIRNLVDCILSIARSVRLAATTRARIMDDVCANLVQRRGSHLSGGVDIADLREALCTLSLSLSAAMWEYIDRSTWQKAVEKRRDALKNVPVVPLGFNCKRAFSCFGRALLKALVRFLNKTLNYYLMRGTFSAFVAYSAGNISDKRAQVQQTPKATAKAKGAKRRNRATREQLLKQIKSLKRLVRYWRQQACTHKKKFEESEHILHEKTSVHAQKKSRRNRNTLYHNISLKGGYTLAMKQNLGHQSGKDTIAVMEYDVSRTSVFRWELQLANSIVVQARHWFSQHYAYLDYMREVMDGVIVQRRLFSYEIHCIRGDGTNTAVAKLDAKAHVCELRSLFVHASPPTTRCLSESTFVEPPLQPHEDDCARSFWGDVLPLPQHCTGVSVRCLYLRQTTDLGMRSWLDDQDDFVSTGQTSTRYFHIQVYIFASDQGGDQCAADALIMADCGQGVLKLCIRQWCFHHVLHLIASKQMRRTGKGDHYKKMMKHCNVWRASGNSKKIWAAWCQVNGDADATRAIRSLPPRPLRGRWGSAQHFRKYLLAAGQAETVNAFKHAFDALGDAGVEQCDQDLDALGEDDMKTYAKRLGKWTRETLNDISCNEYWRDTFISYTWFDPVFCLQLHLQKHQEGSLFTLVYGRAERVFETLDELLCDSDPSVHPVWKDMFADRPIEATITDIAECVVHGIEVMVDVRRRVLGVVASFPCALMWLVFSPPRKACDNRKACARDLITLDEQDLDACASRKLRALFAKELDEAATLGTIPEDFHALISNIGRWWQTNTQEIEGCNNNVKLVGKRCPSISWKLLSSRIVIRKRLAQLTCKSERGHFLEECVCVHQEAQDLQQDSRWSVVPDDAYPEPKYTNV